HTRFSRDWSSDVCSSDLVLHVTDNAKIGQTATIQAHVDDLSTELTVTVSYSLEDTIIPATGGIDQVTNATSIAVIVNKERSLPRSEEHTSELQSRENLVC